MFGSVYVSSKLSYWNFPVGRVSSNKHLILSGFMIISLNASCVSSTYKLCSMYINCILHRAGENVNDCAMYNVDCASHFSDNVFPLCS